MKSIYRVLFLIGCAFAIAADQLLGRGTAWNAILTPNETSRGTATLFPDAAIALADAVVKSGSDDRHFAVTSAQADIPLGVLMHDVVSAGDYAAGTGKNIAIFGVYPETLTVIASAAIAKGAEVVIDPANPGQVITKPATAGQTYIVIGRSRFTVANAGDPCSLIHCVPRAVVQ